MPQPKKAARFGGSPAHHNLMMANLATELFRHGRIRTTLAKAKTVQPLAERMVTFAKRGDLHSRRRAMRVIRDNDVAHKLFADIGPAFATREGGYTRVLKLDPRKGDGAPMALIELVEGVSVAGEGELEEAPRRRWSLRRRRGTQSATAREREEQRAAAIDRGEDPEEAGHEHAGAGEPARDQAAAEQEGGVPDRGEVADPERPEADPAEVEARLGAEDSDDTAAELAERGDAPEPEQDERRP